MQENRPPGCENCKNPCTIHLTQIVEGTMHKVDLCASCPNAKNVDDPTGFSIADQLLGLGAGDEMAAGKGDLCCPMCGFTQADFKKLGRLGCSSCYNTFSEGLAALLRNMHRGTEHKGKIPRRFKTTMELTQKIFSIEEDLGLAIKNENYEDAASLRDKLKKLKAQLPD
ncbi:MAG: UvrB/UvrC motif-containing protein [Verrucomicrobiae bacterium]|nr:UvrB/UvrC motif-containing protein [Verrucomicrobiae bacterium]